MNKNNTKTVSLLSEAIVAVMADKQGEATKLVAQALQGLTNATPTSVVTASKVKVAKKPTKVSQKRGRKPALNTEQVAILNARVIAGDSIASLGRAFGISYPTAVRYQKRALELATRPN